MHRLKKKKKVAWTKANSLEALLVFNAYVICVTDLFSYLNSVKMWFRGQQSKPRHQTHWGYTLTTNILQLGKGCIQTVLHLIMV